MALWRIVRTKGGKGARMAWVGIISERGVRGCRGRSVWVSRLLCPWGLGGGALGEGGLVGV